MNSEISHRENNSIPKSIISDVLDCLVAGDSPNAISIINNYLESHPNHVSALELLAQLHLVDNNLEAAREALSIVFQLTNNRLTSLAHYFELIIRTHGSNTAIEYLFSELDCICNIIHEELSHICFSNMTDEYSCIKIFSSYAAATLRGDAIEKASLTGEILKLLKH